jgi:hypothetical protein
MEPYVPQALPPPNLDLARIIRKIVRPTRHWLAMTVCCKA